MLLRFASIGGAVFLFAMPLVQSLQKITQSPVVIVAVDNSRSMTGLNDEEARRKSVSELKETLIRQLGSKYKVAGYTFGEKSILNDSPEFTEKRSDYGQLLKTVFNNHFNDNVGALVIIGDGLYNQGVNPVNEVKKLPYPVYTLGTGDTIRAIDAAVASIRVNKTAFKGNQFPVEADIQISGSPGAKSEFAVFRKGVKLFSQIVQAESSAYFTTLPFVLEAQEAGLQYYTAVLKEISGEQNHKNNAWSFVIQVLENKQKIAIFSQGTHPDAGAIKNSLEQQINYEVSLFTSEPFPADITGYNLVVMNQIPSSSFSGKQVLDKAQNLRVPILLIIGAQTSLPQFNQAGPGVEIIPRAGNYEDAQPALNEQFMAFTLSNELKENLLRYPPLKVPFARYHLHPAMVPLAFQRIKNITTSEPLIAAGSLNGRKTGIIFGEGLWRWRMYNYSLSGSHREFNELIDKLVQYLALRENEDNFIIDFKPVYHETEPVQMTAEVYNESFEMITLPEVSMVLSDSAGREFSYLFDRASQFYRLDAGQLPVGEYHFKATTELGSTKLSESGSFAVTPVNLELTDLQANHQILFRLSKETGGDFYTSGEVDALAKNLLDDQSIKNTSYFQNVTSELLNLKWIFLVLILLLVTEWFLRKYWGIY